MTLSLTTPKILHLLFSKDVSHETVARRPLLVTLGLSDRSRCGAVLVLRLLAQPSSLWASQIALVVARCSFGDPSHNPLITFGLSDRSCCGAALIWGSLTQPPRWFGLVRLLILRWLAQPLRHFGFSHRCSCGTVLILLIKELLCRDLDKEVLQHSDIETS